eukprot:Sspe_Gene.63549::Locus_36535_Transcript_2_6_Confidence_0.500_Length_408::g.63549::m.63549/K11175/purN; phosphoribosylglycinamide formyltransferase 1
MAPCRLGVLLSGSGTTLQNIIDRIDAGKLTNVSVELVVSSKADAYGIERAKGRNIPTAVVESKRFRDATTKATDWEGMSAEVVMHLREAKVWCFPCAHTLPYPTTASPCRWTWWCWRGT